jgi:hypothetical protein
VGYRETKLKKQGRSLDSPRSKACSRPTFPHDFKHEETENQGAPERIANAPGIMPAQLRYCRNRIDGTIGAMPLPECSPALKGRSHSVDRSRAALWRTGAEA